jgi:septation ring formation regulator EzrA
MTTADIRDRLHKANNFLDGFNFLTAKNSAVMI